MLKRRHLLSGGASALALLTLAGRSVAAPLRRGRSGLIFTSIRLVGTDLQALVDTGGSRAIQLRAARANSLGIELVATGRTIQRYAGTYDLLEGRVTAVDFADVTERDVVVSSSPGDIETIVRQTGEEFDAILGWPLLRQRSFLIDYENGEFSVIEEMGTSARLILLTNSEKNLPVTSGRLDDGALDFLVDTGAPRSNIDAALVPNVPLNTTVERTVELGGKRFNLSFRVKDLSAMSRGLGARAVIGNDFLQQFQLYWSATGRSFNLL